MKDIERLSPKDRLSGKRSAEILFELQGEPIDLLKMTEMPNHAHVADTGRLDEYPSLLRSQILPILRSSNPVNDRIDGIDKKVREHYATVGLKGSVLNGFDEQNPSATFGTAIFRDGNYWSPNATVQLPMNDYKGWWEIAPEVTQEDHDLRNKPGLYIGTTWIPGTWSLYRLDTQLGEGVPRTLESIETAIAIKVFGQRHVEQFGVRDTLDAVVATYPTQRLLLSLLGAHA